MQNITYNGYPLKSSITTAWRFESTGFGTGNFLSYKAYIDLFGYIKQIKELTELSIKN